MSITSKSVSFGSQQEAILTPKEGFMVESVKVIKTVNNEVVSSELTKISEQPAQWSCKFKQPAGRVIIKPIIVPMLYDVEIEENEFCNILLVDCDEVSDVDITVNPTNEDNSDVSEKKEEAPENFNEPQHSFENGVEQALDVEDLSDIQREAVDEVETTVEEFETASVEPTEVSEVGEFNEAGLEPVNSEIGSSTSGDGETSEVNEATVATDGDSTDEVVFEEKPSKVEDVDDGDEEEANTDAVYDAGAFADELIDKEPIKVSRAKYEEKCLIFFSHREAFARGEISEQEYKAVEKKHNQFFLDIDDGKIIVED